MNPTTRLITSASIAALLATACKASPEAAPDTPQVEPTGPLHNALCHVQPGALARVEGEEPLSHLEQAEEMLHLSGVPAVTITSEGATLDHVPIELGSLPEALAAREERLARDREARAARHEEMMKVAKALSVDPAGLTLGLVDTMETNAFFDGIDASLPEGAELVKDAQGHLTMVHEDRSELESFFMGKVDPTHEVAFERVVSPAGEVWRSHYLFKGVGLSDAAFSSFEVKGSAPREWVHVTFSLAEPEPFQELTAMNVARRVVFLRGGEVAAHAMVEEAIMGGGALARFDVRGAQGQLMAAPPAPSPAPALQVFLDGRLTLEQVRERLGVVAAAAPGAIALRMARAKEPSFAEANPELDARLKDAGIELPEVPVVGPARPTPPLAEEVSDACPELVEVGDALSAAFPTTREAMFEGYRKAWAGCGCRGEIALTGLFLETPSARYDRTFFALAEVGEATGEVRTFGGEVTWGEALGQLAPGECVRVLPEGAGGAGFVCTPSAK
jgi:hypothetical protein